MHTEVHNLVAQSYKKVFAFSMRKWLVPVRKSLENRCKYLPRSASSLFSVGWTPSQSENDPEPYSDEEIPLLEKHTTRE
jgi:hypothetical protein